MNTIRRYLKSDSGKSLLIVHEVAFIFAFVLLIGTFLNNQENYQVGIKIHVWSMWFSWYLGVIFAFMIKGSSPNSTTETRG